MGEILIHKVISHWTDLETLPLKRKERTNLTQRFTLIKKLQSRQIYLWANWGVTMQGAVNIPYVPFDVA